jgi:hypothetical protein
MAQLKRVLKWEHYNVRDNARHDIVFNLQTLNRDSLATAAYDVSTLYCQLVLFWGTASNTSTQIQTTALCSAATDAAEWYCSDATGGEMTWVPTASRLLQDNSPDSFHITVSTTSDYSAKLLDWPEGEKGIITVID